MSPEVLVVYRISDRHQCDNPKDKPSWADKHTCLRNFLQAFRGCRVWCVADSVGPDTRARLSCLDGLERLYVTKFGNGARSFLFGLQAVLEDDGVAGDTLVYMVEDDYLHRPGALELLREGARLAEYVSLYDHPDKYHDAGTAMPGGGVGNPTIAGMGETCRVLLGQASHWRTTGSTTMTFAATKAVLEADAEDMRRFNAGPYPEDFQLFSHLVASKGRSLVVPLPSQATHCETAYLAPLVDWHALALASQDP